MFREPSYELWLLFKLGYLLMKNDVLEYTTIREDCEVCNGAGSTYCCLGGCEAMCDACEGTGRLTNPNYGEIKVITCPYLESTILNSTSDVFGHPRQHENEWVKPDVKDLPLVLFGFRAAFIAVFGTLKGQQYNQLYADSLHKAVVFRYRRV